MIKPPVLLGDHPVFASAELEWVTPENGIHLRLAKWRGKGAETVHIFTGRTEYIEKYGDLIERLLARGFNVTCHDWRGQGLSTRNQYFPHRNHIDDFSEFQRDTQAIISACKDLPNPRHIYAHSMGGCIALRYLMGKHNIQSVVYDAPMWGVYIPKIYRPLQNIIRKWGANEKNKWKVVPGLRDEPYETYEPFWRNLLTTSRNEYLAMKERLKFYPELGVGGATYSWFMAAEREMKELENLPFPDLPSLVFYGSKEKVVCGETIERFSQKYDQIRLVQLEGAKHEVYIERKEVLKELWSHIDSFWLSH